ncbi:MAG: flagellar basal body-associated FliL family protein [Planctomycetes bacterium]|nr:flagellar basal body-associated FliL family protein [Planctomycetota bacterium]
MADAGEKGAAKDAKAAPKDGADGAAAPGDAAPGKLKRLLPFIIGGTVAAGLGATAAIVTQPHKHDPEVVQEQHEPEPTPLDKLLPPYPIALPQLIAGLAGNGESARVNIILEVRLATPEGQAAVIASCAKGGAMYAPVRHSLIMLLSGRQASDLRTPRGMEELKLEILDRLKPILFPDPSAGTITGIFFDELLFS